MKKRFPRALLAAWCLGIGLSLSACSIESGEGLASLPRLPGEYLALQQKVDAILDKGYVPAVAESGANRQAMQLQDIDGDGQNEIVSFYRSATSGEYAVYIHKRQGDDYVELGSARGYGKYLREVSYPRLQSGGARAMALSWGTEENATAGMTVHTLGPEGLTEVLAAGYSSSYITDMDGDGADEIGLISFDKTGGSMQLTLYGFVDGQCQELDQAPLSLDAKSVAKISRGALQGKAAASLYIDSLSANGGYVTDVMELRDGSLINVTLGGGSLRSASAWRPVNIACQDIDKDGTPEIPLADLLPGYADPNAADSCWKLRWTRFSDGAPQSVAIETYHALADSWYMRWPEQWGERVSVVRKNEAGVVKTAFLVPNEEAPLEEYLTPGEENVLLNIWIFTGDNRQDHFNASGMKWLRTADNAIYAYSLPANCYPELTLTDEQAVDYFNAVATEWASEVYS